MENCVAFLVALAVLGHGALSQTTCPSSWQLYSPPAGNSSCLWVSREKASWIDARSWCRIVGGRLAEVDSMAYNMKITQLINSQQTGKYWIGITDMETEMEYKFAKSKQVAQYTAFLPGQTTSGNAKNCVNTDEKGSWTVESCKAEFWFVCARKAEK